MTKNLLAAAVLALPILAAGPACAEPTDRSRQVVPPPTGAERTTEPSTRPYGLTGSEAPKSGTPTRSRSTGWRRSTQNLGGGKVQIESYER